MHFSTNSCASGQLKNNAKTLLSHPPCPFPGNFCNYNSGDICTALQFYVQLPLLYTAWSNAYSAIVTLQPLMTSCVKDYKGHSRVQTSFTERPVDSHVSNWLQWLSDQFLWTTFTTFQMSQQSEKCLVWSLCVCLCVRECRCGVQGIQYD